MNDGEHDDGAPPGVDWKAVWPVRWAVPGLVAVALLTAAFALGAVASLFLAVSSALHGDAIYSVIGACGGAVALTGIAAIVVSRSELLNNRLSLGVRCHTDPVRGVGVLLLGRRVELPLTTGLVGMAVYGVCAWFDQQDGSGGDLLPGSKNSSGGANFALAISIVLIVVLILIAPRIFRAQTKVSLYPAGIHWAVAPHLGGDSVFVEWTEIESIRRGEIRSPRANLDVIDIYPYKSASGELDRFDHYVIPVHRLVCDSNSLISVIRYMHEHPERRDFLADPAVPKLFAPPSLRQRMRISRSFPASKD